MKSQRKNGYDHDRIVTTNDATDNVTKELRAAFSFFDRNCNGVIEIDELEAAMKSLGMISKSINWLWLIHFLSCYFKHNTTRNSTLKLPCVHTGYVVSDRELRMMIGEVDVDGNGKIDFDEFVRMMNNATKIDKREGVELREAFKVAWKNVERYNPGL